MLFDKGSSLISGSYSPLRQTSTGSPFPGFGQVLLRRQSRSSTSVILGQFCAQLFSTASAAGDKTISFVGYQHSPSFRYAIPSLGRYRVRSGPEECLAPVRNFPPLPSKTSFICVNNRMGAHTARDRSGPKGLWSSDLLETIGVGIFPIKPCTLTGRF